MPNLRIREGGRERLHQVEADSVTIGRAPTNTITIGDAKASKEHCRIERVGDRWKLVDCESKNGTRVNGAFVNKAWLSHDDTIAIGTTEIRFGLEGAARVQAPVTAAARSRTAAEAGEEEAPPPRRRYARDRTSEWLLRIGLFAVIGLGIFIVANNIASKLTKDTYNLDLIRRANELMARDQWQEALDYLQRNADPEGNAYEEVQRRILEIQQGKDAFYRNRANQLATQILSKLTRRVGAYNAGVESATPEEILAMVERLKTEFADSEPTRQARALYPAWFAGKVPQRATELLRSGGKLSRDWEEALERAAGYEREWQFREARETVERFVTSREAVLDETNLEHYRRLRDERLRAIDLKAQGIYYGLERESLDLVRKKRYDQAIALYRKVIERFGIDLYVRKANEEIRKLQELKRSNG